MCSWHWAPPSSFFPNTAFETGSTPVVLPPQLECLTDVGQRGSTATLKTATEEVPRRTEGEVSGSQVEQLVDELILLANIIDADPPRLSLADHVDGLVSRNHSLGCLERAKALFGLHPSFDGAMILLEDVVQVLDRSMAAAPAQGSLFFHCGNR